MADPNTTPTGRPVLGIPGLRGSETFSCEGMPDWEWARCYRTGCEYFVCTGLSDIYCWHHVDGSPTLGEIIETVKEKANA